MASFVDRTATPHPAKATGRRPSRAPTARLIEDENTRISNAYNPVRGPSTNGTSSAGTTPEPVFPFLNGNSPSAKANQWTSPSTPPTTPPKEPAHGQTNQNGQVPHADPTGMALPSRSSSSSSSSKSVPQEPAASSEGTTKLAQRPHPKQTSPQTSRVRDRIFRPSRTPEEGSKTPASPSNKAVAFGTVHVYNDGEVFNSSNPAFSAATRSAASAMTRGPVQSLWLTILSTWFSPMDYLVSFKEHKLSLSDVSVLEVRWIPPPHYFGPGETRVEPRVFMVEYWSSTADAPGGWQAARKSFATYMESKVAPGRRMLCAVGIGAKCEMYGWDGSAVVSLDRGRRGCTLDLTRPQGRRELESWLEYVEDYGLEFAEPTRPWSRRSSGSGRV